MARWHRVAASVAVAAFALVTDGKAQHEGHQMPGQATGQPDAVACFQGARQAFTAIEAADLEVETARQLNRPSDLRAAVDRLQAMLTLAKRHLEPCVAARVPEAPAADPAGGSSRR